MLASDIVGLLLLREEITALGQQTIATKKVIGMIDKVNGAMTRSHFRKELVRAREAMASAPAANPTRVRPKRTPATAPLPSEDLLDLSSGSDDPTPEPVIPPTEEEETYDYEEEAPPPPPKKKKVKKTKSSE